VWILYAGSIKRAVLSTQYTVRPQSVYRVPYRTEQKNDLTVEEVISLLSSMPKEASDL